MLRSVCYALCLSGSDRVGKADAPELPIGCLCRIQKHACKRTITALGDGACEFRIPKTGADLVNLAKRKRLREYAFTDKDLDLSRRVSVKSKDMCVCQLNLAPL